MLAPHRPTCTQNLLTPSKEGNMPPPDHEQVRPASRSSGNSVSPGEIQPPTFSRSPAEPDAAESLTEGAKAASVPTIIVNGTY
jgi:hypothetical protein